LTPPSDAIPQAAVTPAAPNGATPERPWRHLLRALLWLLGAVVASFCGIALAAVIAAISQGIARAHGTAGWQPDLFAYALISTLVLQATLLLADLKQGRSVGHGNLANGLGAGPMRRPRLIAALAGLLIAWDLAVVASLVQIPGLAAHLASKLPIALALHMSAGPIVLAGHMLLLAAVAPVAEELFFRGWLWTALRRSWGVWPTALCTAGPWLAMHTLDGPIRAVLLLPTAVLLSLARHHGGSVRASLALHLANNTTAVAIQLAVLLLTSD
jgi:uncharacterized protein